MAAALGSRISRCAAALLVVDRFRACAPLRISYRVRHIDIDISECVGDVDKIIMLEQLCTRIAARMKELQN